jgi:NADH:ubiquinone oxidoreductase subunit 2 (subunit N)
MVAGFFMVVGLFSAFYYLRFVKIILFETKAKNSNKESSIFKYLLEGKPLEFTINCLILVFLMLAFFSPDIILPLAQEIIEDLIK